MRRRNRFSGRFVGGLIIFAVLCLFSLLFSAITKKPSPVTTIVASVVTPVQRFFGGIGGFFGKGFSYFTDFDKLKAENEELKAQIRSMEQRVRDADLAIEENNRLRLEASLPARQRSYTTLPAEVIARNPGDWATVLTLSKGTANGAEVGMAVMTNDGLVGYISEAGPNYCKITTITDLDLKCGAQITRTRDSAIAEGTYDLMSEGKLRLSYIKDGSAIVAGDTVETSGAGGMYPRGIMIGVVESVGSEPNGLSYYAVLKPYVDVETVTNVMIITDYSDTADEAQNQVGEAPEQTAPEDTAPEDTAPEDTAPEEE